jgi:hypothetical protein
MVGAARELGGRGMAAEEHQGMGRYSGSAGPYLYPHTYNITSRRSSSHKSGYIY